jgi:hypothetical protein
METMMTMTAAETVVTTMPPKFASMVVKVSSMSESERWSRAKEIAFVEATRALTPEEEAEFIKCCFGPQAGIAY